MLLNCHTYYSLCYGIYETEELLDAVKADGYDTFVLSDINNTSAIIDALRIAPEKGLKPIPGIDFRNGATQMYVGIAMNNEGFRELNEHLSLHLHSGTPFSDNAPQFHHAFVVYPLKKYDGRPLQEHEFVGIKTSELSSLPFARYKPPTHKMVALQTVSFSDKKSFNAHRLLRAIDKNMLLSRLPESEQGNQADVLPGRQQLYHAFRSLPHIITNTEQLLKQCRVEIAFGKFANKNLRYYTGSASGDIDLLLSETLQGLAYRYNAPSPTIMARVEKELAVINEMNFASYFLINRDIIRYAQHKNYYYVGRGSGANSMVAYLLRISDVDPIELDLYFERFINLHRTNPPDFDIDFSWTDRDDITRYIFDRFGYKRTALLGAYNTFQSNAVLREMGKVFGLPPDEIDRLQSLKSTEGLDHINKLVLQFSRHIHGFPSHLSIHSSGILISEEPISSYSATFMPPKGYPTTQFSMIEAEDIGLYKFDILSQRGLGKIKDTLQLIKNNKGIDIDIHDTKPMMEDERVKQLLKTGDTIGCFYIESPATRMLLCKLRADDYLRLVAASSIIRPGVSKSGMMQTYIERYRNPELREKARQELPELYAILEETYGVMVYQEDVIKVAHEFAGISLAEADYLRRGMSWKFKQRNEFDRVRNSFFDKCLEKGYSEKSISSIWMQIESFANYAFSKGHSASYAVESFQALYLKAYYPLEYMVATLNNGGGFYRPEFYVHEARMKGGTIAAPCINNSDSLCVLRGHTIYLGLGMLAELQQESIAHILGERQRHGPFANLADFVARVSLSIEPLRILIRVGAFRFTGISRRRLLWDAHMLLSPMKHQPKIDKLFNIEPKLFELPPLENSEQDNAFDEMELLGFPLCQSPFQLLRQQMPSPLTKSELHHFINREVSIVGYRVTVKRTRTSKGADMFFGTFTDIEGNWIDTVHFPPSAKAFPFKGPGCYLLKGKVMMEYDFLYMDVLEMKLLPMIDRETRKKEYKPSGAVPVD